jgi:uncharacterized protein YqeY
MRADLTGALRSRDTSTVRVLRSTLAAVANAEAQPPAETGPASQTSGGRIAGASDGLGSTDVERRALTEGDVRDIVTAERDERRGAAAEMDTLGLADRSAALLTEATVLDRYL